MFWEFFSLSNLVNHADAMRRRHSLWLTRAMRQPAAYPRIPTRPVGEGGFGPLMSSPAGKAWAEDWWTDTLRMQELDL